ncbi:MAG TPA: hypothetical protein DDW52_28460, partial [Planctomycetaceae bacterium]|nr:hypothetical protein [Planctomycetaceae bacterium]
MVVWLLASLSFVRVNLMKSSTENPYWAPEAVTAVEPILQADARRAIDRPASILMALSTLNALLYAVFFSINFVAWVNTQEHDRRVNAAVFGILLSIHIFSSVSFARVRGCKGYYRGLVCAALATIPGISSCIVVAIPFGIWLTSVLLRPGMYAAFNHTSSESITASESITDS